MPTKRDLQLQRPTKYPRSRCRHCGREYSYAYITEHALRCQQLVLPNEDALLEWERRRQRVLEYQRAWQAAYRARRRERAASAKK